MYLPKKSRLLRAVAALLAVAVLPACGSAAASGPASSAASAPASVSQEAEQPVELVVFAAASLTETLTTLGETYTAAHPEVTFSFNFDSSGTLKTQIEEGADCDLFLSAGQKQMDQLDAAAGSEINPDGLDFVDDATRLDLLENRVTLCVPDPAAEGAVQSFDDLAERLKAGTVLLAMGNSDVPVGQYTQKILAFYGLDEAALAQAGCLTYGSNVKEVTTQVAEGSVDCGVIYCTDAFSAGLETVDYATAEMCGRVVYPAAVLKGSKAPDAARAFLDYLTTEEAQAVFAAVGFAPA